MDRKIETDEFGCKIVYPVPEQKRCPICRNEVSIEDLEDIRMKYGAQLEIVEDHNYDWYVIVVQDPGGILFR